MKSRALQPDLPLFLPDTAGRYAGVDEAGRGPLAGSVVAAAVVLHPDRPIAGLNDSKKLSAAVRARLFDQIVAEAEAYAIAEATVEEIDALNILQASLLAMRRAVWQLLDQGVALTGVRVDGNRCPHWPDGRVLPCTPIVGGDARDAAIAAASILAKVTRDRQLLALDAMHPQYGFAQHKGYPTAEHLARLAEFGPSPVHRQSFAPVRRVCRP
ncbi:ribonuclease HII [Halothiobacillus sp. DCM-1]|uniref:ribonuclease HII n=1 Tax=Halothiobacillus sp. DCM-1 TaxID=3112558 RepID=UPI003253B126